MKILELFSGTESFSKVARERGHKVFTIDNNQEFKPNLCKDILKVTKEDIPFQPDVIWASPPCQKFSVMTIYRNWKDGKPKNEETKKAIEIVKKTLSLIKELNPKYFIIENPRAMLRKQDFMQGLHRDTVTYCQYGLEYQKATDLWNNLNHKFKPMCSPKSPCHVRSPRGSKYGIQGVGYSRRKSLHPGDMGSESHRSPALRGIVPRELCLEIIKHIENIHQKCKIHPKLNNNLRGENNTPCI